VEVYLVFDAFDPPEGRARVGDTEVSFEGWMGLLSSMTDFFKTGWESRSAPDGTERQEGETDA
jgi:hypothetical protein